MPHNSSRVITHNSCKTNDPTEQLPGRQGLEQEKCRANAGASKAKLKSKTSKLSSEGNAQVWAGAEQSHQDKFSSSRAAEAAEKWKPHKGRHTKLELNSKAENMLGPSLCISQHAD